MALDNNGTRKPHGANEIANSTASNTSNASNPSEQNTNKSEYHRSNPYLSEFARERAEAKQRLTSGEGAQLRTSGDVRTDGYGNPIGERSDAATDGYSRPLTDDSRSTYTSRNNRFAGDSGDFNPTAPSRATRTATSDPDDYGSTDRARTRTLNTVTEGVKDTEIARQLRAKRSAPSETRSSPWSSSKPSPSRSSSRSASSTATSI